MVLAINGGSSSIRFAMYETDKAPCRRLAGKIDRIGSRGASLTLEGPGGKPQAPRLLRAPDHPAAAGALLSWLEAQEARARP